MAFVIIIDACLLRYVGCKVFSDDKGRMEHDTGWGKGFLITCVIIIFRPERNMC